MTARKFEFSPLPELKSREQKPFLPPRDMRRIEPQPQGKWWECFVCGATTLCPHREPEIVAWRIGK